MAEQQALNATFFAFRKREKGGVLLGASIAVIVMVVLLFGGFAFLNWQAFVDYFNWAAQLGASVEGGKPGGAPSPEAMMPPPSVMSIIPWYFLFILFYYILIASYEAACLRWMIHGETGGFLGLTLGADTWRVYFGYWIWFFLIMAWYIVFIILMLATGVSVFAMMQGQTPTASTALLPIILCVGMFAALIYMAIRFAPAAATSIARRRFSFFDAWTVTKGRFWALLGSFVLLFLMFFVFYLIVAFGLGFVITATTMAQIQAGAGQQTPEEAMRMLANPQLIGPIIGFALLMFAASMTLYVAMFGVNARAAVAALEEGKIKAAE